MRYADASDEASARRDTTAIYRFLVALYHEAGLPAGVAEPDYGKAMAEIYDIVRNGVALIAERDGELVGSIGLAQNEIWYAKSYCLAERWFYIVPELRDGPVLEAILAEVAAICDALDCPATITIANLNRKRAPRTRLERIGETLTYQPRGRAYRVAPSRNA